MPARNHFLSSLRPEDLGSIRGQLVEVDLTRDQLLAQAGERTPNVYLPINSIISVVAVMNDGRSVESRTIGCESGFGLLNALGSDLSFEQVTCQVSGGAFRLPLVALRRAAETSPTLVSSIARHAQATLLQSAQSTACNCLHTVEQRLCRWLLLTRERTGGDVLPLTQEHLSIMLGVQRTTITAVARDLAAQGLFSYSRGRITLHDVERLKHASCECYEAIEAAAQRILDQTV